MNFPMNSQALTHPGSRPSDVYAAISDPTRRAILNLLQDRQQPVADLVAHFDMTQPAVSQHLRILREAQLVDVIPDGRHRLYQLKALPMRDVHDWTGTFEKFWDEKLQALALYLKRRHGGSH